MKTAALFIFLSIATAGAESVPAFNRDVRSILSDNCFQCHGPDDKKRDSDLRLDTYEGATADLGGYAAIVPGQPDKSELLKRIQSHDPDERMPPLKSKKPALSAEQVDTLTRWIAGGAKYQPHWAFVPVERPVVPAGQHPVDFFIRKTLAEKGIEPAPEADPQTLIRRYYLDVLGLLPPVERVDQFVAAYKNNPESAVERLADLLLADSHYGERWGRHWLDQARYADSDGYSIDGQRQMWPYRDWVIAAVNADMPFDQFTLEQVAGDLLPNAGKSQLVATAFHRNTMINSEGGSDPEQFRNEAAVDRVNTTGAVWLGLTLGCSQCHTHKFDPLTHHDYYSMFAFFNQGTDKNNQGATLEVTEGELFGEVPQPAEVKAAPAASAAAQWSPLKYTEHVTDNDAQLVAGAGNALLLRGKPSAKAVYTITATSALKKIAAVQLRVIPDKSLPSRGPGTAGNGNFVLTGIEFKVDGKVIPVVMAEATHAQPDYPISHAIDGSAGTGWAINTGAGSKPGVKMNQEHRAQFVFANPVDVDGKPITVTMRHDKNDNYMVGNFSLEVTESKPTLTNPQVAPKGAKGKVLVIQDLPAGQQRETYIHLRGDFLNLDKKTGPLVPGVPVIFPNKLPLDKKEPNRIDLAKWLTDPANPLTARVTVNRIWLRYFGKGIVETENDFGTQGSLPSHPELLDWLASEFVKGGWSQKHIHRLILTSRTYRQSSHARPELAEKDPLNKWLASQSRLRIDAEIVRDAALSASGLLHDKIGGPSVHPPQPAGVYSFTQNKKSWNTSTGPDRYRRSMYTEFFRSAPYPTLTTFDSPNFVTTCTSRARSNTPLQSLTMANDEAMLELAAGLAERIKNDDAAAGIESAYRVCFSRLPTEVEQKALTDFINKGAMWSDVARVLINTDEFITRE